MARLDDLVAQVSDDHLRAELESAVANLKRGQRFGLVFEEHIPESVALPGLPVRPGTQVLRRGGSPSRSYRVMEVKADSAAVEPLEGGEREWVPLADLLAVKRFGEPIYPALLSLGKVERGGTKPYHAAVNGENFHVLQLLGYLYPRQVDCIYIDPPYNTGARDWKYNNRYVDDNDVWRHSKWLAFMERRLQLAKRLLKADGVLIVTVDKNEVHHLGMLLERLFPEARQQMVSICINPSGASGEGLSRVDEYAFFCFTGAAQPSLLADDMLNETGATSVRWESLLRRGNQWYRQSRPNLCYPVLINKTEDRIVGVGRPFTGVDEAKRPKTVDGFLAAWPVRNDGKLGIWRVEGPTLMDLVSKGFACVTTRDDARGTWSFRYLMSGTVQQISAGAIEIVGHGKRAEVLLGAAPAQRKTAKSMWHRGRHTAGGLGGTQMLTALLGRKDLFPFPKSVYAVRDCLEIAVGDRPDALVLDFFAGSGTTLHATCMLNAEDGGRRRCVLATNNEVHDDVARQLNADGHFAGDADFEEHGIFEQVTWPRCEAAITGVRPDGKPAEGDDLAGRPLAQGYDENAEFYRLEYLDPDDVRAHKAFNAILPALWLRAGGRGPRPTRAAKAGPGYAVPSGGCYAVLFSPDAVRPFLDALTSEPGVSHVYVVTDSESVFSRVRRALPAGVSSSRLYRDYLRNFEINTGRRG